MWSRNAVYHIQSKPYSVIVTYLNQLTRRIVLRNLFDFYKKLYKIWHDIGLRYAFRECVITRKTTSTYLLPAGRYIDRDICRNKPAEYP